MAVSAARRGLAAPLALGLMLLQGSAWADYSWNFPTPVTPLAADTLRVHNLFMVIITVIFVVVFAIMLYSIFTHRKSRGYQAATFTAPSTTKQVLWTLVPFALLLFIDYIVFGIPAWHAVVTYEDTRNDADMVVKVTGSQWKWTYEYPDQGIKFVSTMTTPMEQILNQAPKGEHYLLEVDNPLVLPINKKIRFITTSTDVIHSWWVPAFGVKRDAVPGFLREFWAKIEQPGVYRGQCAELCGKDHGFMPAVVHAVPEAEYQTWLAQKKEEQAKLAAGVGKVWTKDELVAHGREVYLKNCAVCHQPDGKGMPPAFPALTGSAIVKGPNTGPDGRMLKDGHLDRVFNGKAGTAMAAFKDTLSDVDIAAVVTFERNQLGNAVGDLVQPADVKTIRAGGALTPSRSAGGDGQKVGAAAERSAGGKG